MDIGIFIFLCGIVGISFECVLVWVGRDFYKFLFFIQCIFIWVLWILDDYIFVIFDLLEFFFFQYDVMGWLFKEYKFCESMDMRVQQGVDVEGGSGGVFQLSFVWDEVFGYYYDVFLGFYYDGN